MTQRIGSGVLKQPPSVQCDSFSFCIERCWCHLLSCGPAKLSQVCDAFGACICFTSPATPVRRFWPIKHKALRGPLPALVMRHLMSHTQTRSTQPVQQRFGEVLLTGIAHIVGSDVSRGGS